MGNEGDSCNTCGSAEAEYICSGCLAHLRVCEKKMLELYCTIGGIETAIAEGEGAEMIEKILDACKVYGPLRAFKRQLTKQIPL